MYFENSYFTVALYLSVFVGVFLIILHWRNSTAAESRMQRMMMCFGIDQNTATHADKLLNIDMRVVRERCRHCAVANLCEHWLGEEAVVSNNFCPNASVFRGAAATGHA